MAVPQAAGQVAVAHLVNNMHTNKISFIIPCLNEEDNIRATLLPLQSLRQRGHEIIIGDGGSTDNTISSAKNLYDQLVSSKKGRALQMNSAAKLSSNDILCFLHADTLAPENIDSLILDGLQNSYKIWGRFNINLSGKHWLFRIIEASINIRSCISGVASGDQGIFIYRNVFDKINGFKPMPLMEDIDFSKRLKETSRPICISNSPLITSSRRWERHGILRTVFLMWRLRLKFFMGVPTEQLENLYRRHDK
jgi:rSAM/selenodomain-associated transferase 2